MFTKDELGSLKAIVSQARVEGVQAAAVVVSLFHKIDLLINSQEKPASGGNDSADSTESRSDTAA